MHVLLVAPQQGHWVDLANLLVQEESTIDQVDSYPLARKRLDTDANIDLVIVDADCSDPSMVKLVAGIKGDIRLAAIPIIAAGSNFSQEKLRCLLTHRVESVLVLPTDRTTLQAKLASTLLTGKKTVLVVDDEPTIVEYLKDLLEIERFNVLTAGTGEEALRHLKASRVDVVVSDITMPGMSGLDLLVEVKNNMPHIPVILITGNVAKYPPKELIAAGADAYFAKPFKNKELVYTLRGVMAAYAHQHRHQGAGRPA